MRLVLGSDHAGYELKEELIKFLTPLGHEVLDVGTCSTAAVDYPDYAQAVSDAVLDGRAERGVLICGSGVGVSVAANKIPGIRAALCHDIYSAHQGVEHDDLNVICIGARAIGPELMLDLLRAFLAARFTGEARHLRRLAKIKALEAQSIRP